MHLSLDLIRILAALCRKSIISNGYNEYIPQVVYLSHSYEPVFFERANKYATGIIEIGAELCSAYKPNQYPFISTSSNLYRTKCALSRVG